MDEFAVFALHSCPQARTNPVGHQSTTVPVRKGRTLDCPCLLLWNDCAQQNLLGEIRASIGPNPNGQHGMHDTLLPICVNHTGWIYNAWEYGAVPGGTGGHHRAISSDGGPSGRLRIASMGLVDLITEFCRCAHRCQRDGHFSARCSSSNRSEHGRGVCSPVAGASPVWIMYLKPKRRAES